VRVFAGTRLGPYEIVAAIGAGGMGEVYKDEPERPPRNLRAALSGVGGAVRVSSGGGSMPRWSPAGKELFYIRGDELVAVTYRDSGGRFEAGDEKVLFAQSAGFNLYSVAPDGQRFLVGRRAEPEPSPGIRVILNWSAEFAGKEPGR